MSATRHRSKEGHDLLDHRVLAAEDRHPGAGPLMFELQGSAAVVTGAARGIGLAICEALARQGSRLTLLDADEDAVRAAAKQLGPEHRAVCLDVTDHDALSGAILAALGDIEGPAPGILVNNAAVVTTQAFDELTLVEWQKTLDINLTAAMIATRSAAAALRPPGGGRVINIASIAARLGGGLVGSSAYATSKGGLIALTRACARELAPRGITVNAVAPGPIETRVLDGLSVEHRARLVNGVPLGRLGGPDDVAAAVCFLASAEAGWITGQTLDVNGGMFMN
ncbi:MAG: SDR family oxidoreductase [Actinomycetota bacterium]|nr:SDR family oxidoreductase [Actinomycetota bacterium]MDQ3716285.1 SDR family oxidoreductase [Actinomycetota bacterium]